MPDGTGLPKKKHLLDQDFTVPDPRSVPSTLLNPYGRGFCGFDSEGWGGWWGLKIAPGTSPSGFIINSRGLPGIREVKVTPKLQSPTEDQVGDFELAGNDYWKFIASVNFYTKAVAPTAPPGLPDGQPNLSLMMEQLSGYLDESVALGWLKDAALHDALKAKAGSAIAAAGDTNTARAALDEFIALVSQSVPAQRTDEAYALFYFNAKYILDHLPPFFYFEENLTLSPERSISTMGAWVTLNARYLINQMPAPSGGPYGPPLIRLHVISGPNMDVYLPNIDGYLSSADDVQFGYWHEAGRWTDIDGNASLRYYSMQEGTDTVVAEMVLEGMPYLVSPPVEVKWKGGPDMVVGDFFPPLIRLMPGETTLQVEDGTLNQGNGPAGPSITRYYLSTDADINTAVDQYLGERAVPALAPGRQDKGARVTVNLPANLQPGALYYIGACVDADQTVPELDENNNCSTNGATQITMPMEKVKNQPPVCAAATARLKNPDAPEEVREHLTPADVLVENVTDPDGDVPVITVSAVTEIEEVEDHTRRDHHDKNDVEVKNWLVAFTADDGKGGTCGGETIFTLTEVENDKHHSKKEKEHREKPQKRKK
ncbi:MAG: hypothetical protein HZA03_09375 [Nitrospinae bacterium]|nr:hypothetical protein [Nitrospinota bacterium]